jgi:hypothetical protein
VSNSGEAASAQAHHAKHPKKASADAEPSETGNGAVFSQLRGLAQLRCVCPGIEGLGNRADFHFSGDCFAKGCITRIKKSIPVESGIEPLVFSFPGLFFVIRRNDGCFE